MHPDLQKLLDLQTKDLALLEVDLELHGLLDRLAALDADLERGRQEVEAARRAAAGGTRRREELEAKVDGLRVLQEQLPHGTARRLVETLAHPLNQPRFNSDGTVAAGSYTVIQPRVSPTLLGTSASLFSRLFADAIGIDPYSQSVSDVNQDLTGEGSYHGKGIYDVRAFSRALSGKFPNERVLSHEPH